MSLLIILHKHCIIETVRIASTVCNCSPLFVLRSSFFVHHKYCPDSIYENSGLFILRWANVVVWQIAYIKMY